MTRAMIDNQVIDYGYFSLFNDIKGMTGQMKTRNIF